MGFPVSKAALDFEKLIDNHSERYNSVLNHIDGMIKVCGEVFDEFKNTNA